MTKRWIALLLALVTLLTVLTGCAKTKKYIEPEEFEIYYYPQSADDSVKFAAGTNCLQIIMNTPTGEAGAGVIGIYRLKDDSLFAEYDVRNSKNIYLRNDTAAKSCTIVVILADGLVFEAGESYYVTLGGETFYVDDLKAFSGAVEKGDWVFHIAEYGLGCNLNDIPSTYLVGDTIEIPVNISAPAAQAVLTIYDETFFGADVRAISESGTLTATAKKEGSSQIGVMYLDENGKWLDGMQLTLTVK